MILTNAILNEGMSARGGWCLNQFRALGVELREDTPSNPCSGPKAGWKAKVLGKDFPESCITEFLSNKKDKKPRTPEQSAQRTNRIKEKKKNREPTPQKIVRQFSDSLVIGSEFLRSYEWRVLRMQALKKYGARCQCCGATPATGAVMNVDHIKPRRIYPALALELDNLQILCDACNHGKGNWDMTDWRKVAA